MVFTTAMLAAAAVAEVMPKIWNLIKKAEVIIPEAGMGRIKKQLVMAAIIDDALGVAGSLLPGLITEQVRPLLEKHLGTAIDTAVKILNSVKYLQRTRLNPEDFGKAPGRMGDPESGKAQVGTYLVIVTSIAAIFSIYVLFFLISCGGTTLGIEPLYEGPMTGEGKSALFVQKSCYAAQDCAGGEALDQGLPNLIFLGPKDSNAVQCNGATAGSCYDSESRSIILPSNPNEEAILTACLYDWSFQITGDPDFAQMGEAWTRGCSRPYRIVE